MTPRIQSLLDFTFDRKQDAFRHDVDWAPLLAGFVADGVSDMARARIGLCEMLRAEGESPAFLDGERIAFTRTVRQIPDLHTDEEMEARRAAGTAFGEKGVVFNLTADFGPAIAEGLDARLSRMRERLERCRAESDAEGVEFLENAILSTEAVLELVERYRAAAEARGLGDIAETLSRVPRFGARTLCEALQSLRILHYALWCEGEYHCGLGRIDQYLLPYFENDLREGRLDEDGALELLEEFFVACNRDSDLYIGVQQGDNGQSVMLGGVTRDGKPAFNDLSRLCLKACGELKLVDPKINLRVDKTTPPEIFRLGTELTAKGLGFPQYANDDVVIPALERWGYAPEDARDYTVAACWEFIIPGCGLDIDNIDAVSFPGALDAALRAAAKANEGRRSAANEGGGCATNEGCRSAANEGGGCAANGNALITAEGGPFIAAEGRPLITAEGGYAAVEAAFFAEVQRRADALVEKYRHVEILPGPFVSTISTGCVERARDISCGAKYNNFGIHGTGISVAVDSLAAVRELVFEKNLVSLGELVELLDTDFASRPDILAAAKAAPKMGNADPRVDEIAKRVIDFWGHAFDGKRNDRGGIFRPGTGSAMYYVWHAREIHASPCGRLTGEPFPANWAPSLDIPVKGPVSVIRSFTEPDLGLVSNGGPLTIEIHGSAFLMPDGVDKVAELVRFFILRGGHQLQINAIDRKTLLDAQEHPEKHRHLIVRVWGWSGYFVELDREFQNQIIRRVELAAS
ncbi:MAG: pyruvate formate-lyase [Kiritimatiellae bacterium]|nr:pyruvate formate-lyase [Kiritimatiellia bacterium]